MADPTPSEATTAETPTSASTSPPPRPPLALPLDAEVEVSAGSKTLLCTSVTAPTLEAALEEVKEAAAAGATAIELRLDCLTDFDPRSSPDGHLRALLSAVQLEQRLPAVVTFRPKWEGGKYEGDEAPRLAVLKFAALLGARFVDVEVLASPYFFAASGGQNLPVPLTTSVILSHHDYEKTPDFETLRRMVSGMFEAGADVAKIATTAKDDGDAAAMLSLAAVTSSGDNAMPCIALAMGEKGLASRVLAPKYGSFLTFGALGAGRASAPGQPSLSDLVSLYRLPSQSRGTEVLGVIGNPVSHSRSPALHNAAIRAASERGGRELDAVYLPFLVDDLARFLEAFDDGDYRGFSVTIPHKLSALECASECDEAAARIGAANTLVRQGSGGGGGGKLKAYNTDAPAAIGAIERGLVLKRRKDDPSSADSPSPLKDKTVVVLGAGGAGRALAFGAASAGASRVVVANRDEAKAKRLADDVKAAFGERGTKSEGVSLAALVAAFSSGSTKKVDVVANTTSVGMAKRGQPSTESPLGDDDGAISSFLSNCDVVFDAVYTPLKTKLLEDAERAGCETVSGLEMFVGQAALQFELFFPGVEAPLDVMREAVLDSVRREEEEGK